VTRGTRIFTKGRVPGATLIAPFPWRDPVPQLIHGSFGSPESVSQTAAQLVQSFCSADSCVQQCYICDSRLHLCSPHPCMQCGLIVFILTNSKTELVFWTARNLYQELWAVIILSGNILFQFISFALLTGCMQNAAIAVLLYTVHGMMELKYVDSVYCINNCFTAYTGCLRS